MYTEIKLVGWRCCHIHDFHTKFHYSRCTIFSSEFDSKVQVDVVSAPLFHRFGLFYCCDQGKFLTPSISQRHSLSSLTAGFGWARQPMCLLDAASVIRPRFRVWLDSSEDAIKQKIDLQITLKFLPIIQIGYRMTIESEKIIFARLASLEDEVGVLRQNFTSVNRSYNEVLVSLKALTACASEAANRAADSASQAALSANKSARAAREAANNSVIFAAEAAAAAACAADAVRMSNEARDVVLESFLQQQNSNKAT